MNGVWLHPQGEIIVLNFVQRDGERRESNLNPKPKPYRSDLMNGVWLHPQGEIVVLNFVQRDGERRESDEVALWLSFSQHVCPWSTSLPHPTFLPEGGVEAESLYNEGHGAGPPYNEDDEACGEGEGTECGRRSGGAGGGGPAGMIERRRGPEGAEGWLDVPEDGLVQRVGEALARMEADGFVLPPTRSTWDARNA